MSSIAPILEIIYFFGKVIPILLGIVGAFLFLSPKRLPRAIRSRWYWYLPTLFVICVLAGVSLISVFGDITRYFEHKDIDHSASLNQKSSNLPGGLPPVEVPEVAELPDYQGRTLEGRSFAIADVTIGMSLAEADRTITKRDQACLDINVEDQSWTGITVTIAELDPVFQNPTVIECYENPNQYEHIYLFPDVHESNSKVLAVARISKFSDLRGEDIRELLERRYGPAVEPWYQPNYGTHLYWIAQNPQPNEAYLKENEDCFLYLPRALKSSLEYSPVSLNKGRPARAQLNSSELIGDCGLVLTAFISNTDRRLWLLAVNTSRVQAYREYANNKSAAEEIERINRSRRSTKF